MKWIAVAMRDYEHCPHPHIMAGHARGCPVEAMDAPPRPGPLPRTLIGPSIAAGIFLVLGQPCVMADNTQGAQLAATCASCHRLDGRDKGIPAIVGVDEEKLARALFAYRAKESPSHIMRAVALSLSDEEIAIVARYLAKRGRQPP